MLFLNNCLQVMNWMEEDQKKFDLIYADMIYEDENLDWITPAWELLKENGIFIVQTDFHTDYLVKYKFLQTMKYYLERPVFVSDPVVYGEWGNYPKDRFARCYDNILIFAKGKDWYFNPEVIQVPKKTLTKGLNPSGRTTKTATCWIDDCVLTTTSKERVKKEDGHLLRWQKPLKLFDRILLPFLKPGDSIFDPFAGSGTVVVWSLLRGFDYIGSECDSEVFALADQRIKDTEALLSKGV